MRQRNVAINIRVTESEKNKLEKAAKLCRLSLSAYLRKAGLGKPVQAAAPQSFYEAYRLITQLRDRWKTMNEASVDRAFKEVVRCVLTAYHDLNGGKKEDDAPWQ